jgi:transposase
MLRRGREQRTAIRAAVVAVEHAMLITIWHMINDQTPYRDPGADYYTRLNPDKIKNRTIDQLTTIGYTASLPPRPITGPQRQGISRQEHL